MSNDLAAISAKEEPPIGHYEHLNTIGQGTFAKVRTGLAHSDQDRWGNQSYQSVRLLWTFSSSPLYEGLESPKYKVIQGDCH